ncbi:TDRD9-like protein [Mya arenaria]|uniref:RNA helicase n=1 Tax=Mya arenaria TaxID=6604 RepID=A0ABY7FBS2_MYAAR|nr:TDRD9-like protein [Mya arenaria]
MSLIPDITTDQIDDWFKIGKKTPKVVGVRATTVGGRSLDPETLQPKEPGAPSDTMSMMSYDTMSVVSTHLEDLELDTIAGSDLHTKPGDLAPENANHVYGSYNFTHAYDQRLPITKFKEQVTVIQGATGSGKTTQVAQYILDYHARLNKYCNIIVTQPRRIAAISIARRVCQERGWELGTICGYQVHERDQDTDFSLLVVRKLLRTNSRHTRVVLMSATFDSMMFAQYFALPVLDKLEQAPVVDVEGKPFKVLEFYADDLSTLGPLPVLEESDPSMSIEAKNLAVKLIEQFDKLEEKEQGLRLLPLHSTITQDEQTQVFNKPGEGMRKVHWASKANCTQRKGRAGRVSNGRVYRLVTRHFYDNYLQDYGLPEMQLWEKKRERGEFRRVSELIREVEKRLSKFNILKPRHEPYYKANFSDDQEKLLLKVVLAGAFYPHYFIRGEIDEMDSLKSLSGRDPLNTVMLRMPLFVDLYSSEEAHAMLERLEAAQGRVALPGLTGANQVTHETGSSREASHVPPPDPEKEVVSICITEVVECGHFWAQYGADQNCMALHMPMAGVVRVGQFCVAPYADEAVEYYRARIQSVFFVDYGNSIELAKEELRELPSPLLKTPFQAFECKLVRVRPSAVLCPDGKWTEAANLFFKKLVLNQRLIARPYSSVHNVLRVQLIHVLPGGAQFLTGERLISEGFADEAEESALSKQSNEQRVAAYVESKNDFKRAATGGMEEFQSKPTEGNTPDWLHLPLGATGGGDRARQRGGRVEQNSVNSVAIDDEPHDQHQRMMIAGFVGLNPNGSTVVARDTTIMPLIPGLPAIITLIFTPVAELRPNPKKTRMIGAICGLGFEADSGEALLPDHDIELPFDVTFTNEDISDINGVRLAINFAIGNQDTVSSWGLEAVFNIQEKARCQILKLLQRRRKSCEVEMPQRLYCWNQVDPEDVLSHNIDIGDCNPLLPLHSCLNILTDDDDNDHFIRHIEMLRETVRKNIRGTFIDCELCQVRCPNPQLLALHMETQKHKTMEQKILSSRKT